MVIKKEELIKILENVPFEYIEYVTIKFKNSESDDNNFRLEMY